MQRDKRRDDNRANFPNAAAVLDTFRKVFGDKVKLVYAAENGKEIGNSHHGQGGGELNSEQWRRLGDVGKQLKVEGVKRGRKQ